VFRKVIVFASSSIFTDWSRLLGILFVERFLTRCDVRRLLALVAQPSLGRCAAFSRYAVILVFQSEFFTLSLLSDRTVGIVLLII
jgi:hypothetical protein